MSASLKTEWFLVKQKSYMFYIYITAYAFVQSDLQYMCLSIYTFLSKIDRLIDG